MCGSPGRPCFDCLHATMPSDNEDMKCILGIVEDWNIGYYSNFAECDDWCPNQDVPPFPYNVLDIASKHLGGEFCKHSFRDEKNWELIACPVMSIIGYDAERVNQYCGDCREFRLKDSSLLENLLDVVEKGS